MKEGEFSPEFTHQVFGDNEIITGYANLAVKVSPDPHSLYILYFFSQSSSYIPYCLCVALP